MSNLKRFTLPEYPENLHPETLKIKKIWDHHSSYQWVYFDENYKKMISYYLFKKLTGPNLEIGGGWYLSHPNSAVVDISEKALAYNLAKNKDCFDLDDLGRGKRLPHGNSTFETATMVSVWQYLRHPDKLLKDLERVLVPGGELYIINEQGAGLDGVVNQSLHSNGILKQVLALGYEARHEELEIIGRGGHGFEAVIVKMPENMLFDNVKMVKKTAEEVLGRDEIAELKREKDAQFRSELAKSELKKTDYYFHMLDRYPVTEYFNEYLKRFDEFSIEYKKQTGDDILCTMETSEVESHMSTKDDNLFSNIHLRKHKKEQIDEIIKKIGIRGCFCHSSLEDDILSQLKSDKLEKDRFSGAFEVPALANQLVPFLCHTPLNNYTAELQIKLYANLKLKFPNTLDDMIFRIKARRMFRLFDDNKQRKRIIGLIAQKRKIEKENIPTVGVKHLDYLKYMREFEICIADQLVFRRRQFSMDD